MTLPEFFTYFAAGFVATTLLSYTWYNQGDGR